MGATTVGAFFATGATTADLKYDLNRGYCKISDEAAAAARAAAARAAVSRGRSVTVVFTTMPLGMRLEYDEPRGRILFNSADASSPAARLTRAHVLVAINGAAVGPCDSRDRYRETTTKIIALAHTREPLRLEFRAAGAIDELD